MIPASAWYSVWLNWTSEPWGATRNPASLSHKKSYCRV